MAQGPLPVSEVIAIARQMAEALDAPHEHGIVHRDLKPANIKLTRDGLVKVLDFGLARMGAWGATGAARDAPGGRAAADATMLSPAVTEQGVILGAAAYMAPEQARGQAIDKRADIWAFGVVLYELLTGRTLFAGATMSGTIANVLKREVLPGNVETTTRGRPTTTRHAGASAKADAGSRHATASRRQGRIRRGLHAAPPWHSTRSLRDHRATWRRRHG